MREIEMRQRIEGFLKRRMQGMLAPALGLGLTMAGCVKTSAVYSAPVPIVDAAGVTHDAVVDSAPKVPDAYTADAFVAKDTQPMGPDSAQDLATTKDSNVQADVFVAADATLADVAWVPDASKDSANDASLGGDASPTLEAGIGVDSGSDLGSMVTKYMAPNPDAGRDLGAAPLYMAPLYMASIPLG